MIDRFELVHVGRLYKQFGIMQRANDGDWIAWSDFVNLCVEVFEVETGSAGDDVREIRRILKEAVKGK